MTNLSPKLLKSIEVLSQNLPPKKLNRIGSPGKRIFIWLLLSLLFLPSIYWFIGYRKMDDLFGFHFFQLIGGLALSLMFSYLALASSVPGITYRTQKNVSFLLSAFFISGFFVFQSFSGERFKFSSCSIEVALFSLIPTGILFIFFVRAYSLQPYLSALWLSLSGAILAGAGQSVICANDFVDHLWLWHYFFPSLATLLITILSIQWFLKHRKLRLS